MGLIVVGIWLFGWFWEIELKDDDFELWFLFEWWNCVRNLARTVGNLWEFWVGGWRWWKFNLVP
jgi:hypothetical protein